MKNFYLFILITVNCFSYYSQEQFISKGDSLRNVGNLEQALIEYKLVYKNDSLDSYNTYQLARALALSDQKKAAFNLLKRYICMDSTEKILIEPDFYFLAIDSSWNEIENLVVNRLKIKNIEPMYIEQCKKLWKIRLFDQAFYYELNALDNNSCEENIFYSNSIWELKRLINLNNLEEIQKFIQIYGYPYENCFGRTASSAIFLVVQHADLSIQNQYLPYLMLISKNEPSLKPSLALLIDRINVKERKRQIYGSQVYCENNGNCHLFQIDDPLNVNKRRKEMNLEPIEEYLKEWNIIWNPDIMLNK